MINKEGNNKGEDYKEMDYTLDRIDETDKKYICMQLIEYGINIHEKNIFGNLYIFILYRILYNIIISYTYVRYCRLICA